MAESRGQTALHDQDVGSFTRAAEVLVVTQPAVSLQIRSLERDLGVKLLNRQGIEIVPTAAGQILYRYARTILAATDEAEREIAALAGSLHTTLALGASATGVAYYLPPLIRAFAEREPAYDVLTRVDITDRVVQWTLDGRVELALVWGPVENAGLVETRLGFDCFVLICPPDHPLAASETVDADHVATHPFVMGVQGSSTRRWIEGCLARVGVRPRVAAEVPATADMKRAVEVGLGIAVVGRKAVEEELARGSLRAVEVRGMDLWRPVSLIVPRRHPLPRGATLLSDFLASELHLPAERPHTGP